MVSNKFLGVALATFVAVGITACGDLRSKGESVIKKKYPDAKILSFGEIQKEFGLKDKECLDDVREVHSSLYHFVKKADGELSIIRVETDNKSGYTKIWNERTLDEFKKEYGKSSCF